MSATTITTKLFVVVEESYEGNSVLVDGVGAYFKLEDAEDAVDRLNNPYSFICEYSIKTRTEVPSHDLTLLEWEEWTGPVRVSFTTKNHIYMEKVAECERIIRG